MSEAINDATNSSNQREEVPQPLKVALWLARKGMYVHPLDHPDNPECTGAHGTIPCDGQRGKHPRTKWQDSSTTDPEKIRQWAKDRPTNFGIDCGKSGIVVFDEDKPGELQRYIEDHPADFEDVPWGSLVVKTGKGSHLYYKQPVGDGLGNRTRIPGYEIDVRGNGGYVVAGGSLHQSGVEYTVQNPKTAVRAVPAAFVKAATSKKGKQDAPTGKGAGADADTFLMGTETFHWDTVLQDAAAVENGSQRTFLIAACGSMWKRGMPLGAGRVLAQQIAAAFVQYDDRGWDEDLVDGIVDETHGKWFEDATEFEADIARDAEAQEQETEAEEPEKPVSWMTDEYRKWLKDDKVKEQAQFLDVRYKAQEIQKAYRTVKDVPELPGVLSLTDFLAQEEEAEQWRIEGLLPSGGRVVLAAAQKAGKTTFTGNLVRSLVDTSQDPFWQGGFLEKFKVNDVPGDVVLVDNEMSTRQLRQWYQDLKIENTDRVKVYPLRGQAAQFNIINSAVRAMWAKRLKGASFVILDCLSPFLEALELTESNEDVGKFLSAVDALITEAGISDLVLVHHMGHGTDERSRGASRLRGWPDAEWKLVKERDDKEREVDSGPRFFSAFGRDVSVGESQLEFDPSDRTLKIKGGNRAQYRVTKYEEPIIEWVRKHPGQSGRAIVEALMSARTLPKNPLEKAVKALQDAGRFHTAPGPRRSTLHFICEDSKCTDPENCILGQEEESVS